MKLRYAPAALDDLRRIRDYIRDELAQPVSAERIPAGIVRRCARLATTPLLGPPLQPRVRRKTDLRVLTCRSHVVFYRVENTTVSVIRILHVRQDFVAALEIGGKEKRP